MCENVIPVDFKQASKSVDAFDMRMQQYDYLMRRLPEIRKRQQRLRELRAPRCILDNEARLVWTYTHRLNRLQRYIDAGIEVLKVIFSMPED